MIERIPRYRRVRKQILTMIKQSEGNLVKIPPERELCDRYDVSRPTIRHAIQSLTEDGFLIPKRGMGTFVNRQAIGEHHKRVSSDLTVGLVLFAGDGKAHINDFLWTIVEKTVNDLSREGCRILFLSTRVTGDLAAEEMAANDLSGVIWLFPNEQNISTINRLDELGIPVVCVNRDFGQPRMNYVMVDQQLGGYMAAQHLLELGHRDILFVGYDQQRVFLRDRYLGFIKACVEYNVIHDQKLLLPMTGHSYTDMQKLLGTETEQRFSAVFVAYGVLLNSVANAIKDEGRTIPADYSVLSYDIDKVETMPDSAFTVIEQPVEELGARAAQALLSTLLHSNGKQERLTLKPRLVIGNTSKEVSDEKAND